MKRTRKTINGADNEYLEAREDGRFGNVDQSVDPLVD